VGLFAGIGCGLFLGEKVAPLQVPATGFVKLLQMTVLPYVVLSIIISLGSLGYAEARRLGLRVGAVVMGLWAVAIGFAFLMPLSFPPMIGASFFSHTMVEQRPPFNFVDLYIPSNPFHSLANNIVPATVMFSVVLGVALIGVPEKQRLLDVLRVAMEAVSRATRLVTKLTPFGIFAIVSHASGTLSPDQLSQLEIYLISYIATTLMLVFWVLPGLVQALTPLSWRDMMGLNRDSLITAFVAGDVFIVLPALIESCEQIMLRGKLGQHDEHKLPEVIIPASFNFPHSGKLLSLSFILFAGWFSRSDVPLGDYPLLAATGILTIFGSLNAAIPFLLDLLRIPADTFQLYLATGVLNARFGSLLAAMHVICVGLLGSAALAGSVRVRPARLATYGIVTFVLTFGAIGGLKVLFAGALRPRFEGAELVNRMRPLLAKEDAVLEKAEPLPQAKPSSGEGVLDRIRARGFLRVGFFPNRLPFIFQNRDGKLMGYEMEAAHLLAEELGVKPRFVELEAKNLAPAMASGVCDIIMSGVAVTPQREIETLFSHTYLDQTAAFVVLDHRRHEFSHWATLRSKHGLKIATPNIPHYVRLLRSLLPAAEIVPLDWDDRSLDTTAPYDGFALLAEQGAALTLLNPQFTVVVPLPDPVKIPTAYPLASRDLRWAETVNSWIELRQKDGTLDRLYRHWILGQSAQVKKRRWSILEDVLGYSKR
jgi:Na+/H+-dicarboxylate symporter